MFSITTWKNSKSIRVVRTTSIPGCNSNILADGSIGIWKVNVWHKGFSVGCSSWGRESKVGMKEAIFESLHIKPHKVSYCQMTILKEWCRPIENRLSSLSFHNWWANLTLHKPIHDLRWHVTWTQTILKSKIFSVFGIARFHPSCFTQLLKEAPTHNELTSSYWKVSQRMIKTYILSLFKAQYNSILLALDQYPTPH